MVRGRKTGDSQLLFAVQILMNQGTISRKVLAYVFTYTSKENAQIVI